jgi:Protein of unknown function (DUF2628)
MSLLRGMKIYTVHIPSGTTDTQEKAVFLREGFNWQAFFFGVLWALYHRLWLQAFGIVCVNVVFMALEEKNMFSSHGMWVAQFGFQVAIGFLANDWLRAKFGRRGYILADVTAADSLLRAQQRYYERLLAAH